MAMHRITIAAAIVAIAFFSNATHAGDVARRIADRQARAAFMKTYPEKLQKAQAAYTAAVVNCAQWLAGLHAKDEALRVAQEAVGVDAKSAALLALNKTIEAITIDTPLSDANKKEEESRLKSAQKARATGYVDLARTCFGAGLYRQSFELITQAINLDPDNPGARQALGQVKAGENWWPAWTAGQVQKGNTWVPEFGWVSNAAVERTKKGEWFDNGRWTPIADADKAHQELANPWVIETEHFILKSNASRKAATALSERLEGFWQVCYHEYLELFIHGNEKKTTLSFAQTVAHKLLVYHGAQPGDYESLVKRDFPKAYLGIASIFSSLYFQPKHALYSNGAIEGRGTQEGLFAQIVWGHELARQIVVEYLQTGAAGPKPWISGAISEGVEFANLGDDGKWIVPSGHQHPDVTACVELMKNGMLPPLSTILPAEESAYNKDSERNNHVAGAFFRFMLETSDGQYASDILDYVADSFKAPKGTLNLHDYVGMENADLEKAFVQFLSN